MPGFHGFKINLTDKNYSIKNNILPIKTAIAIYQELHKPKFNF